MQLPPQVPLIHILRYYVPLGPPLDVPLHARVRRGKKGPELFPLLRRHRPCAETHRPGLENRVVLLYFQACFCKQLAEAKPGEVPISVGQLFTEAYT